jgi:hypothetical protein
MDTKKKQNQEHEAKHDYLASTFTVGFDVIAVGDVGSKSIALGPGLVRLAVGADDFAVVADLVVVEAVVEVVVVAPSSSVRSASSSSSLLLLLLLLLLVFADFVVVVATLLLLLLLLLMLLMMTLSSSPPMIKSIGRLTFFTAPVVVVVDDDESGGLKFARSALVVGVESIGIFVLLDAGCVVNDVEMSRFDASSSDSGILRGDFIFRGECAKSSMRAPPPPGDGELGACNFDVSLVDFGGVVADSFVVVVVAVLDVFHDFVVDCDLLVVDVVDSFFDVSVTAHENNFDLRDF